MFQVGHPEAEPEMGSFSWVISEKGSRGGRWRRGKKLSQDVLWAPDWLLPGPVENPGAQVTPWVRVHLKARRRSSCPCVCQSVTSGCLASLPHRVRKEGAISWSGWFPSTWGIPGDRADFSHQKPPPMEAKNRVLLALRRGSGQGTNHILHT